MDINTAKLIYDKVDSPVQQELREEFGAEHFTPKFKPEDWIVKDNIIKQVNWCKASGNMFTDLVENVDGWELLDQDIYLALEPETYEISCYEKDDFYPVLNFNCEWDLNFGSIKFVMTKPIDLLEGNYKNGGIPQFLFNAKEELIELSKSNIPVPFVQLDKDYYLLKDLINFFKYVEQKWSL